MNNYNWKTINPQYNKNFYCLNCKTKSKISKIKFNIYPNADLSCSTCHYKIRCKYCLSCPNCTNNYFFATIYKNNQLICPSGHIGTTNFCSIL